MDNKNKRILIIGSSADMAAPVVKRLAESGSVLGLHYNKNRLAVAEYSGGKNILIKKDLTSQKACEEVVDKFVKNVGGIDALVQFSGGINEVCYWEKMTEKMWDKDISLNLLMPFFAVQRAVKYMKRNGGRIVLMGTSSASHGGGSESLAYGAAKYALEGVVKRMAKDLAQYNILVNLVAPGFILSKFHDEKVKKSAKWIKEREGLVPLKRTGTIDEAASLILYLLSEGSSYITGQIIRVDGGDWL